MLLGTLVIACGISNASLWIDEGYSGMLAAQPGLRAWGHALNALTGSDSQLPGYYLYLWIWSRVFGWGGLALRLANIPWIALLAASLAWASKYLLHARRYWLVVCLSPFLWYYANEARPYFMIMALSMAALTAVLAYLRDPDYFHRLPWLAVLLVLLLWFTHMLAITVVPSLLLVIIMLSPKPLPMARLVKDWRAPVLTLLPLYLVLASYYLYTLTGGRGGVREKPGLGNLAFAIYEFLGFDGLGPPRSLLRDEGLRSVGPYLGVLALGVVAVSLVTWVALSSWRRSAERRAPAALLFSLAFGVVLIFALSYAAHFRLLGRHIAVFFSFLVLLSLAALPLNGGTRSRTAAAVALSILAIAWTVSDARARLLPKYQKDDYRDAVAIARASQRDGYQVLWLADIVTANYYGLSTTRSLQQPGLTQNSTAASSGDCSAANLMAELQKHRRFVAVLTDRPSYDPSGQCRKIIESLPGQHVTNLNDFEIWRIERP